MKPFKWFSVQNKQTNEFIGVRVLCDISSVFYAILYCVLFYAACCFIRGNEYTVELYYFIRWLHGKPERNYPVRILLYKILEFPIVFTKNPGYGFYNQLENKEFSFY